ncbi:MAG: hypothetical protein COT67_01730 [Candidatus Tagabacteria bacterium CG09_land_8_20_14_0_10_41_14]|uniref:Uncharacterized protein n=2 Tax=Candidatus Tagaibacteriota TaxID=1817918 RepID=A0A2H0WN92_9BACT|nr:MAG: hypothetical protein COT67_01730 [Candidatus Tagabacteria bacterium CG09_land_8_20_14_0_10_41_14]PJE72798.1 MAG: hypothetical protein COV00_03105 [Candidatus Tagabacteria bacterium CG10_big_fil_rev_8_21_14_0_10_40_13]
MQEMPPEVYQCLENLVGADTMVKFKNGEAMPPKEIGDLMRECFEQNIPQILPPCEGEECGLPPKEMMQPKESTEPTSSIFDLLLGIVLAPILQIFQ